MAELEGLSEQELEGQLTGTPAVGRPAQSTTVTTPAPTTGMSRRFADPMWVVRCRMGGGGAGVGACCVGGGEEGHSLCWRVLTGGMWCGVM
jgi:hypothetical protein